MLQCASCCPLRSDCSLELRLLRPTSCTVVLTGTPFFSVFTFSFENAALSTLYI